MSTVIENPILNSPYSEPTRHFRFSDDGITDEIVESRRSSTYFVPVPKAKKKSGQTAMEWTEDRIQPNEEVDRIRTRVGLWRQGNYAGITATTRRLLDHWTDPARDNKLFFCQIEALETAIYITEVASKFGDGWIADWLRSQNDNANPGLPRLAFKMATGSGKTVVMAMLIAWQALNKLANTQDARFSDTFLIISPGITIRDRLRVLLPNDADNYYRQRDLVPGDLAERLNQANILITNYHAFLLHETLKAPRLTKKMVDPTGQNLFRETPSDMVRRVCGAFRSKKNIIVINDEAHHCYRRRPDDIAVEEKLTGEDRQEARKRDEEARVWISGIEAVKAKIGVKAIYDLSATPFFLRGSGYSEGTLFPWVVSDFSLIDAIESGIVKVPRVPVADNAMTGDMPTYRDLWMHIREALPRKGRGTEAVGGPPKLPAELQGALHTLYSNYEKAYRRWEQSDARERGQTPPVFIVVCNNTNVSKLVYDYVAGWEKPTGGPLAPNNGGKGPQPPVMGESGGAPVLVPGELPIFSNVKDGRWLHRPNTILVDSEQLESGEAMTAEFKAMAAVEIEEFKSEYRARFPGKDVEKLTDEEILREVMNTVGKPGKLGEQVRCVVSVSMLTEGWDANTVTHILGVRAFGTQLLCEQVVGRGLRRTSYVANEEGRFEPEYAEVYGVPFSFIPCSGGGADPPPPPPITRVRALEDRAGCEITFPRLTGYRFDVPADRLAARFNDDSRLVLSTQDAPTSVDVAPIVGEGAIHTLDDLRRLREQHVAFFLAKMLIERYFSPVPQPASGAEGGVGHFLFPQALAIVKRWMAECVYCKDNAFPQLLRLHEKAYEAAEKLYQSIVRASAGEPILKPILQPYDTFGSTRYVDFNTTKPTYKTRPDRCHVSHVVGDTGDWEQKLAQTLEEMPEVLRYVKNQNLGFCIPYTLNGEEKKYYPDFIAVCCGPATGPADRPATEVAVTKDAKSACADSEMNLIIEVTGLKRPDKEAKVSTARTLWVPAVNNHGGLGRWAFVEITDPWDAKKPILGALKEAGNG